MKNPRSRPYSVSFLIILITLLHGYALHLSATVPASFSVDIDMEAEGKAISPLLMGIFFEDLNHAADGGLYAELIQNRSFEFSALTDETWNALSFWKLYESQNGHGRLKIDGAVPLHPNNPQYGVLSVDQIGESGVGIENEGYDGFAFREGSTYEFSVFARQLFIGDRWADGWKPIKEPAVFVAQLIDDSGAVIGEASFEVSGEDWQAYRAEITANCSADAGRFRLVSNTRGGVALDMISLFPTDTYKHRKNGLRKDLAETIEALHPRFVRFPGGCLVHGNGLSNMYRWKDTVGPLETRRGQSNLWGYHQSVGLGYFEYFQFCEDIGAEPLPVVSAGVCCQHSGFTNGKGQRGLPMEDMPSFVQDILDLIEWANGPVDSKWGSLRAEAGHPEPFGLAYLGVGNEDVINSDFRERFTLIFETLKKAHPEIVVVGTAGPFPAGEDYEKGWELGRELKVPVLDEHCYQSPDWYWSNLNRWDRYDRNGPKVYLGEWAAHDEGRRRTLRSALSEAAYLTAIERNADEVIMTSYAPLLAKENHINWNPDLIYFDNRHVLLTPSYLIQKIWAEHGGDQYLSSDLEQPTGSAKVVFSLVKNSKNGDVILKLVNGSDKDCNVSLKLNRFASDTVTVKTKTLGAADQDLVNTWDQPNALAVELGSEDVSNGSVVKLPPFTCKIVVFPGE